MKKVKRAIGAVLLLSMLLTSTAFAKMNGIDVSSWQTGIDISQVDCDFVVTKATEGTSYVNPDCDRVYQQAKSLGKELGVYHYASGGDAVKEANYFVDNIAGYIGEAILVLDFEGKAVNRGSAWAKTFLDTVYTRTGVKPLIYMSASVVSRYDWSSVRASDYGLWVAGYSKGDTVFYGYNSDIPMNYNVGVWSDCVAMYQYTSSGRLSGYSGKLDMNVFYGDESTWNAYAGGGNAVTKPSEPINTPTTAYTVHKGNCLYNIALSYGVNWRDIANMNGIYAPYIIYPGQVLTIHGNSVTTPGNSVTTYTVQSGDCLSTIAAMYNTTWQNLANINGITNADLIYPGQVLKVA